MARTQETGAGRNGGTGPRNGAGSSREAGGNGKPDYPKPQRNQLRPIYLRIPEGPPRDAQGIPKGPVPRHTRGLMGTPKGPKGPTGPTRGTTDLERRVRSLKRVGGRPDMHILIWKCIY